MKFEWDPQKNAANITKHELDFADAARIFSLPLRISLDERQNYDEDRWVGLGMLDGRIVMVVFTEPDWETIRIISLRKALPHERKIGVAEYKYDRRSFRSPEPVVGAIHELPLPQVSYINSAMPKNI
jgi:uncharacterized protein